FSSWPLHSWVSSYVAKADVKEVATCIRAGIFDDILDWKEAEVRWKTSGIAIDDILYMTDERWPFDSSISKQGFPANAMMYGYWVENITESGFRGLLEIYELLE